MHVCTSLPRFEKKQQNRCIKAILPLNCTFRLENVERINALLFCIFFDTFPYRGQQTYFNQLKTDRGFDFRDLFRVLLIVPVQYD